MVAVLGAALLTLGCADAGAPPPDGATGGESPTAILVAHRGASAYAPEHTMAAYELGIEQGADYIEPDLQITRDGVLIALHDLTLERTTDVEDVFPDRFQEAVVRGETVRVWPAADFTLDEIRTLDAGSWFDPSFADARVPTFREVVELARGRAGLFIETKSPEVYDELGFDMGGLLLAELAELGLAGPGEDPDTPVIIQSFSSTSLQALRHDHGTDLPLAFLIGGGDGASEWLSSEGLNRIATFATGIGPSKNLLRDDETVVERAHALGLTVVPWTFRARNPGNGFDTVEDEMAYFLDELGVDGIITDNPDLFPRTTVGGGF